MNFIINKQKYRRMIKLQWQIFLLEADIEHGEATGCTIDPSLYKDVDNLREKLGKICGNPNMDCCF